MSDAAALRPFGPRHSHLPEMRFLYVGEEGAPHP